MKKVYKLLTQLTANKKISQLTGKIAKSRISKGFIPHFAKTYQINLHEAEKEIHEYPTLNAFFTRRLKADMRKIDVSPQTIVSPVDALITGVGTVEDGTILNIKGQTYTISEMLDEPEQVLQFNNSHYIVLYLSPTDYHRIHVPISGEIIKHVHKLGKVYPVNDFGLRYMKRVLSRNERLITYIKNKSSKVAVVKVGALNVASIQLSIRTKEVEKGDELAYFEFGSTVVLLIQAESFQFKEKIQEGERVQMGEAIGKI